MSVISDAICYGDRRLDDVQIPLAQVEEETPHHLSSKVADLNNRWRASAESTLTGTSELITQPEVPVHEGSVQESLGVRKGELLSLVNVSIHIALHLAAYRLGDGTIWSARVVEARGMSETAVSIGQLKVTHGEPGYVWVGVSWVSR